MTTVDVAADFAEMCKAGQFEEAGHRYWSDDVVSIEAFGDSPVASGRAAVLAKTEWWNANFDVHSVKTVGPYVNGDQFMVNFTIDCTVKASGQRSVSDEMALYTVKNGKIIEERFFLPSMATA
jgi:ketosteroid isomerase-like protein